MSTYRERFRSIETPTEYQVRTDDHFAIEDRAVVLLRLWSKPELSPRMIWTGRELSHVAKSRPKSVAAVPLLVASPLVLDDILDPVLLAHPGPVTTSICVALIFGLFAGFSVAAVRVLSGFSTYPGPNLAETARELVAEPRETERSEAWNELAFLTAEYIEMREILDQRRETLLERYLGRRPSRSAEQVRFNLRAAALLLRQHHAAECAATIARSGDYDALALLPESEADHLATAFEDQLHRVRAAVELLRPQVLSVRVDDAMAPLSIPKPLPCKGIALL